MTLTTDASADTASYPYSHELQLPEGMDPYRAIDDTGTQGEPYAHYAWMRKNYPVLRCQTPKEDVRKWLRNPEVFRSVVNEEVPLAFLALMDGIDHVRLRKIVAAAFTPNAVSMVEDRVWGFVTRYLDDFLADGGGEVIEGFGKPVTMETISGLLDIPIDADLDKITRWSDQMFSYLARVARSAVGTPDDEKDTLDFFAFITDNLRRLHREGSESVGGHIARMWIDEGELTEKEAKELTAFVFVTGFETTTRFVGAIFRELKYNGHLLEALRTNPERVDAFVEVVIRLRGPVNRTVRRTSEEVEIQGVTIPSGSIVRLLIASANRDEAVWGEDAHTLDLDRDNSGHFGFGYGIHACLGAPLARLEARVVSQELSSRLSSIAFNDETDLVLLKGGALPVGVDTLRVSLEPVG
jgi:cytochrome P450